MGPSPMLKVQEDERAPVLVVVEGEPGSGSARALVRAGRLGMESLPRRSARVSRVLSVCLSDGWDGGLGCPVRVRTRRRRRRRDVRPNPPASRSRFRSAAGRCTPSRRRGGRI